MPGIGQLSNLSGPWSIGQEKQDWSRLLVFLGHLTKEICGTFGPDSVLDLAGILVNVPDFPDPYNKHRSGSVEYDFRITDHHQFSCGIVPRSSMVMLLRVSPSASESNGG